MRINKTDRKRPTHDRATFQPQIIQLLRSGRQLLDVCAGLRIGRATIWRWTQADPAFGVDFKEAQQLGHDASHAGSSSEIDRAYVAGFFDGEGCIRLQRGAVQKNGMRYYFPIVSLSNTNEESVVFIHERWPGIFQFKKRNGSTPNSRPVWTWQRSGVSAEVFLRDVGPFLRVKAPQSALVAEYLAFVGDRRRTHERSEEEHAYMIDFYVRMTLLNHRGLKPPRIRTD